MAKKITIIGLLLFAVGASLGIIVSEFRPHDENVPRLSEQPIGGDFTLRDFRGDFRLSDYRGKVLVIYFGYTFCPDICPTNLALITQALNEMQPGELQRVQPVFISVDPDRDTTEKLKEYVAYFHPRFLGITGTEERVKSVADAYGVAYAKVKDASAGGYLVDHSSETYIIAPNGSLTARLHHATPPTEILLQIRRALGTDTD